MLHLSFKVPLLQPVDATVLFLQRSPLTFTDRLIWGQAEKTHLWSFQELSMMSCPEPHSTNSISPLEWEGVSRETLGWPPNTFSCSSMMSLRRSAIINRRKSKEPGGPCQNKDSSFRRMPRKTKRCLTNSLTGTTNFSISFNHYNIRIKPHGILPSELLMHYGWNGGFCVPLPSSLSDFGPEELI